MSKFFLILLLLPGTVIAQKKNNFFLEAGADFYGSRPPAVFNLAYNYSPLGKFGFGLSTETSQYYQKYYNNSGFRGKEKFGLAAFADLRYYFNLRGGSLIPLFQFGYNFFSDVATDTSPDGFKTIGGMQFDLGFCYSINLFKDRRGITISVKYIYRRFGIVGSGITDSYAVGGIAPTIGFRF